MRHARVPESMLKGGVSYAAYRVMLCLMLHADRDGRCHPGNATIARMVDLDIRKVKRCLAELRKCGAVIDVDSGRGRVLELRIAELKGVAKTTPSKGVDSTTGGGGQFNHGGVAKTTTRGVAKTTTPYKNIPLEQTIEQGVSPRARAREEREPFDPTDATDTPPLMISPDPEPTLAERVAKILRHEGDPDYILVLEQWVASADERTVLAAAGEAAMKAQGDPFKYFLAMCRGGLKRVETRVVDPPARPAPTHGYNGVTYPQTNRRPTPEDLAAHEARLARMAPVKPARPPKPGIKLAGSA